jgi:hypothetical protein
MAELVPAIPMENGTAVPHLSGMPATSAGMTNAHHFPAAAAALALATTSGGVA